MGWTGARAIAFRSDWSSATLDYDGPCCYLLGTGGIRGGRIRWHYIGETSNAQRRMAQYASHGSHLAKVIDWHLKQGWVLYYRAWAMPSKQAAVRMQNRMLAKYRFDWNVLLND